MLLIECVSYNIEERGKSIFLTEASGMLSSCPERRNDKKFDNAG